MNYEWIVKSFRKKSDPNNRKNGQNQPFLNKNQTGVRSTQWKK